MLEALFSEIDLCILNDGSVTSVHPATSSTSTLDLSICGPSLVLDYEWNIHEDLCGSDHFPVILTSKTSFSKKTSKFQRSKILKEKDAWTSLLKMKRL